MRSGSRLGSAAALVAAAAAVSLAFASATPVRPRLAFTCGTPEQICAMNADGSGLHRVTNDKASDESPSWSPDGRRIVFDSNRDGNRELYVIGGDGKGERRLTRTRWNETDPAWSPDGKTIAFVSDRSGHPNLYEMNATGTAVVRLTNEVADDTDIAWAPNGKGLAFASNRSGEFRIYVLVGKQVARLTPFAAATPTFAPDGKKLAVTGSGGLYVLDLVQGAVARLTRGAIDTEPAWSPDGTAIAFRRGRVGEIYLIRPDGSGLKRLTHSAAPDTLPAWSRR